MVLICKILFYILQQLASDVTDTSPTYNALSFYFGIYENELKNVITDCDDITSFYTNIAS